MGGVIALSLTACTTEPVFDEQSTNDELPMSTNSFNDKDSGGYDDDGTKHPGINYVSPWDIWYNRGYTDQQPSYIMNNGSDENLSPYRLEVFAWAGLAYFDGDNNGVYDDIYTSNSFPMNSTTHPTLYANNQEVGNLVRTVVHLDLAPQEEFRFEDRVHHLPMPGGNPKYAGQWPQAANGFDFGGALSPQEEALLRDYGKVFFYEVNVFEAATGTFVGTYFLHPEIKTLPTGSAPNGNWQPVLNTPGGTQQLQGDMPPLGAFDLFYYDNGSGTTTSFDPIPTNPNPDICNSYEVVFDAPPHLAVQNINGSVPKVIAMDFLQHPFTFWQNSALSLGVY
ncbi:hypothetical protein NU10_12350 [Flavobacterium dauae]|uniref:hypothetical protein n=1 Tax=Flavobacterium dauae TaxID=1563479 RepID=UPI00101B2642|nr:hypothetical protein [Flavobacterium dauae]WLD23487.1 hypothetical protein NU10_12350 [Flavobacterium dauae]